MKEQPTFIPGKRKYLFLTDQQGYRVLKPMVEKAVVDNASFEMVFLGDKVDTSLEKWLEEQKMGSYLYAVIGWALLEKVKNLALEVGYSEEEVQFIGHGTQETNVFCCRCHGITNMTVQEGSIIASREITCIKCQLPLSVSDHYSSLRHAYLGYVAKL